MRVTQRCSRPRQNSETSMCGACGAPPGPGTGAGLTAREAAKALALAEGAAIIGLPGLDHGVGDRPALAVEHDAGDDEGAGLVLADDERPLGPRQPDREERPDGLGRRELQAAQCSSSNGVDSRPRSTTSKS